MVDEMTQKLAGRVCGRPLPSIEAYNLKRKPRCRPAAGAAEPSSIGQPQVAGSSSLRQTCDSAEPKNRVTSTKGGAAAGEP
jgi:hypothetical protein